MTVLGLTAITILLVMGLALVRAFAGPSLFDRILAVNVFGTKTVLMISVVALLLDSSDYLDVALTYALINFIAVVAVLKFGEYGDVADPYLVPDEEDKPL